MALDKIVHKREIIKALKAIYSDTEISPFLGFKGDTAAMLFYDLSRFSVDLDFDILDISKKDFIFEKLKEILGNFGELKHADHKAGGLFFSLSYNNKLLSAENLKFDFSTKQFGSKYEVLEYLGLYMKVMTQEDLMAHKMCAMYERGETTNRDIFDVWFFLQNSWPVNKEIIKLRTNLEYLVFLKKLLEVLEKNESFAILESLGELLESEKQKVWVKNKLRGELLFLLKLAIKTEEEQKK